MKRNQFIVQERWSPSAGGGGCGARGRGRGARSPSRAARALRPRLELHSPALNDHAYESHLHFPAAAAGPCPRSRASGLRTPHGRHGVGGDRESRVVDPGSSRTTLHLRFIYNLILFSFIFRRFCAFPTFHARGTGFVTRPDYYALF